jgi:retron-type reverse transcriptase
MSQIENLTGIDLTGKQQHGFKRNKSTTTLSLQLQSLIARALDEDNFALMASVDLSAAFDVVNIDLLLVRLRLIGLPGDLVGLIEVWLRNRFFYVEVSDHSSNLFEINTGTIQGSILGPILYAIYVAPLFDLTDLSNFADDNFILSIHKIKEQAIESIEIKLKIIIKWLTDSGLKVNEQKTELCLFTGKTPPLL